MGEKGLEMENFKFRTEVDIKPQAAKLDYSSRIMMLGSCFTTEIGKLLQNYRFDVTINPFGTLYNPASIHSSLARMVENRPFTPDEVIHVNPTDACAAKKYASFYHHSSFARLSEEDFLDNANACLKTAHQRLVETDFLIITLGTAWVFVNNGDGKIVSNCHKRLAREFTRKLLTTDETAEILSSVAKMFPNKHIIFTVSPIRHFKDGAHGNQISKSTLLMGIEKLIGKYPHCCYFPSYEIMMDELRDYRFYAEDMLHPSPLAVKYIFEKFKLSHISETSFKQMEENMRLTRAENHIQR